MFTYTWFLHLIGYEERLDCYVFIMVIRQKIKSVDKIQFKNDDEYQTIGWREDR